MNNPRARVHLSHNNSELKNKRVVRIPEKHFNAEEVVFREGELGHELYIIQEGSVDVIKGQGVEATTLATLEKGALFGEMALIDQSPRSATIKAVSNTKLSIINKVTFAQMMKALPSWLYGIIAIIASRLRQVNETTNESPVKDTRNSLLYYVYLRCKKIDPELSGESVYKFEYFDILDGYCFNTHNTRKVFQKILDELTKEQKFLSLTTNSNYAQEIKVININVLKEYVEELLCMES